MNPSIRLLISASLLASPLALGQEPAPGASDIRRPAVERPAQSGQREMRPRTTHQREMPQMPQFELLQRTIREQNARFEQTMRQRDERLAAATRDFDARLQRLETAAKRHPAHPTPTPPVHAEREKVAAQKHEAQARELAAMKERLAKQEKELKNRASELDVRAERLEALEKRLREAEKNPRNERKERRNAE